MGQAGSNTLLTDAAGSNTNDSMLQPSFLSFDLRELEGFRYRIDDMKKCVSKAAVRDARLAEIKQEFVNSEALQSHFVTNPNDFQVLRHDKNIGKDSFRTRHLKTLPAYLLPQGMKIGKDPNKKRKRKHNNRNSGRGTTGSNNTNSSRTDPLQNFNIEGNGTEREDNIQNEFSDDNSGDEGSQDQNPDEQNLQGVFHSIHEINHESTSGRQEWKKQHKKG